MAADGQKQTRVVLHLFTLQLNPTYCCLVFEQIHLSIELVKLVTTSLSSFLICFTKLPIDLL